jgi:AraC-like DNA-binding protein
MLIVDAFRARAMPALGLAMPSSASLRAVAEHCTAGAHGDGTPSIARRFGFSVRTLERRFAAETGMTFGQWRRHARFLLALRLLAEGRAVKTVARDAGYRSPSAFVAAFSDTFGTTPGRYFGDTKCEVAERACFNPPEPPSRRKTRRQSSPRLQVH